MAARAFHAVLMKPTSFSHWGQFWCRPVRVFIRMIDHQRVQEDWCSEFWVGDKHFVSCCPTQDMNERTRHDYRCFEDNGLMVDWDSLEPEPRVK